MSRKRERDWVTMGSYGESTTGADTLVLMGSHGKPFAPHGTMANQPVPLAMRMRRIALHTATAGVTSAGNWTMQLFVNDGYPVPAATFNFNPTTLNDSFVGEWSNPVLLQPGDRWWIAATGPERNILLIRATLAATLV